MSKVYRNFFADEIRRRLKNDFDHLFIFLLESKNKYPPVVYKDLLWALEKTTPKVNSNLRLKGKSCFSDLMWNSFVVDTSAGISKQISFANEWLIPSIGILNGFLKTRSQVESLILAGDLASALKEVIAFRTSFGWSVWAMELEFSLVSELESHSDARKYFSSYFINTTDRIASLFARMLQDRVDPNLSIWSFIAKCRASFPKLNFSSQVEQYLVYRAYSSTSDLVSNGSTLLDADQCNSVVDYYETLVEVMYGIIVEESYTEEILVQIRDTASNLLAIGLSDFRLEKIVFVLTGEVRQQIVHDLESNVSEKILDVLLHRPTVDFIGFGPIADVIVSKVKSVQLLGSVANDEIAWLYKFGMNFRGIPIGGAILGFVADHVSFTETRRACSPWIQLNSRFYRPEDCTAFGIKNSLPVVSHQFADLPNSSKKIINTDEFETSLLVQDIACFSETPMKKLWLLKELQRRGEDSLTEQMISELLVLGSTWARESQKVQVLFLLSNDKVDEVLTTVVEFLVKDEKYRYEFPLTNIFRNRKWSDFKVLDPMRVALVANAANSGESDSNIRYICRMACRAFRQSNNGLFEQQVPLTISEFDRLVMVEFLKNVWIDSNLTMVGFQSTQEVRKDRIEALQYLLQLDPNDLSGEYENEIKELTFSESISQGLQHIDGSRIFVNQGPIMRWAEKEFRSEFDRWRSLDSMTTVSPPSLSEITHQYLLGNLTSLEQLFESSSITEADVLVVEIVERLLTRFLYDPSHGLNCYLSSRIRHGSLRGILLGPLEDVGFIGVSDDELINDWRINLANLRPVDLSIAIEKIKIFDKNINRLVVNLINEIVQIRSKERSKGQIYIELGSNEFQVKSLVAVARATTLTNFISQCFDIFWEVLKQSLSQVAEYFRITVKHDIQNEFDVLINDLKALGNTTTSITTSLKAVATATQVKCDVISNWFTPSTTFDSKVFSLDIAIEIAKTSTHNVYNSFPLNAVVNKDPQIKIPLTATGLSSVTDCLYILLENGFKHSGLKTEIEFLEILPIFHEKDRVLEISVSHPVSSARKLELEKGGLELIRERYTDNPSIEHAQFEGGSGFSKLSRVNQNIDKNYTRAPLTIEMCQLGIVTVTVSIPVFLKGEAYDAFSE